ncbi:hypothetical protein NQZ68_010678 [Dissostichus eleginoides]|nr:hypothetical protein NQZ68_010678 [Dissostichus eleginoides]
MASRPQPAGRGYVAARGSQPEQHNPQRVSSQKGRDRFRQRIQIQSTAKESPRNAAFRRCDPTWRRQVQKLSILSSSQSGCAACTH